VESLRGDSITEHCILHCTELQGEHFKRLNEPNIGRAWLFAIPKNVRPHFTWRGITTDQLLVH